MQMSKNIILIAAIACCHLNAFADADNKCEDNLCINEATRPGIKGVPGTGWVSTTPIYRLVYKGNFVKNSADCSKKPADVADKIEAPKGTKFRGSRDEDAQSADSISVDIYAVPKTGNDSYETIEAKYFQGPWTACLNGAEGMGLPRSAYTRIGGFNTGILVVPFKIRSGDIYGDSTIGPYLSYKFEYMELVTTAGLTQISTVENGSGSNIKSETGLTFALGVVFPIKKDWDIAVLAGWDRLSGDAGRQWKYQHKPWASVAIGFNFTR